MKVLGSSDEVKPVVRLFVGYGDSPIWVPGGPMEYGDTCLSVELLSDLTAWEAEYYRGKTGKIDDAREGHLARGRELAERLASELGNGFSVSTDETDEGDMVLISSNEPAVNPDAERAFARRICDEAAEAAQLNHEGLEAYAPISKQVFGKSRKTKGR